MDQQPPLPTIPTSDTSITPSGEVTNPSAVPTAATSTATVITTAATTQRAVGDSHATPISKGGMDESPQKTRRSSSRSIKRKKFDDELVESSITPATTPKNARVRLPSTSSTTTVPAVAPTVPLTKAPASTNSTSSSSTTTTSSSSTSNTITPVTTVATTPPVVQAEIIPPVVPIVPPPTVQKRQQRPMAVAPKRRRHRNIHQNAVKDIGRWKPQDDLSLVLAVQQTADLEAVHRGVKFTCKFTLREIEDRWYALLYDPVIAKIAVSAMRQLHPDVIAAVHRKALFSVEEEELLKKITSTSQPTEETFQELLNGHTETFLLHRTARCLMNHWTLMKHYHLLTDQTLPHLPRHEEIINFSDAEELIEKETKAAIASGTLFNNKNSSSISTASGSSSSTATNITSKQESDLLNYELALADRKAKREIRQLENEIPKWQVLVDSITGVAPSDFDNQTLAVLRGRLVRYLMRSREITLGRSTKDSIVDVDLSLEGPAFKISRRQGLIKLQANGDFMIANTGKRPFYVDSKPVLAGGNCAKLNNNSVVEVSGLRFVFLINQDLIASVRAEALKSQF